MRALALYNEKFDKSKVIQGAKIEIKNRVIQLGLIRIGDNMPVFFSAQNKDSVLVKKTAFSCNYRDISIMLQYDSILSVSKNTTFIPIGSDFCGVIVDKGVNVSDFEIGDRVIPNDNYPGELQSNVSPGIPSNHASVEFEVFNKEKVIKIPNEMNDEIGAAFSIGAQTAYSMIEKLEMEPGAKILITGANSNTSLFVLNALKNIDRSGIYGTIRNASYIQDLYGVLPKQNILMLPRNIKNIIDSEVFFEHLKMHGKFDYIIDIFSDDNFPLLIDVLKVNGKYITCGTSNQFNSAEVSLNISNLFSKIITNNITFIGNCLGSSKMLQRALHDYQNKKLDVCINKVYEEDIQDFLNATFLSKVGLGKVVFKYKNMFANA